MREMKLQDLKAKTPAELVSFAEELEVENASTMRKQELMFGILKQLSMRETDIVGEGVVEVLSDGFGFLRSPEANYLPGPDDIYVSPSQIRRFGLRTGDTLDGHIRSPKEGERYFALLKVNTINFEDPEKARHKVNFDNLTPLYPDERLNMEHEIRPRRISRPVSSTSSPIGKGQRALIVSAAARQQGSRAGTEHRPLDHGQPSRMLSDRAAHRRAPGGSHRHAALGQGRRWCRRPSTTGRAMQVAEMVIERPSALVESTAATWSSCWIPSPGWDAPTTSSSKVLTGGIDANALQRPRRWRRPRAISRRAAR